MTLESGSPSGSGSGSCTIKQKFAWFVRGGGDKNGGSELKKWCGEGGGGEKEKKKETFGPAEKKGTNY